MGVIPEIPNQDGVGQEEERAAKARAWLLHTSEAAKSLFGQIWMNDNYSWRDYNDGRGLVNVADSRSKH